ncbi:MAG: hypothetical protein QOI54_3064, partial [Actinomycetota bacterium]|nr:hypothetical protein [Actinomycetota bacterium]
RPCVRFAGCATMAKNSKQDPEPGGIHHEESFR